MRQIGLTVILAQVGCMVPAASARLGITDRILVRVGAVDDLSQGQSTFQVEMAETAVILQQRTSQSLVLLDEIGRGTAVADGIAIALAVAEDLAGATRGSTGDVNYEIASIPRTIFVTHYHELNTLASLSSVAAFRMEAVPTKLDVNGSPGDDDWFYTHRILPGPSWDSHGLTIARRAGFPEPVIERATEILNVLRAPSRQLSAHLQEALSGDLKLTDAVGTVPAHCGEGGSDILPPSAEKGDRDSDCAKLPYNAVFEEGRRSGLLEAQARFDALMTALLE